MYIGKLKVESRLSHFLVLISISCESNDLNIRNLFLGALFLFVTLYHIWLGLSQGLGSWVRG